MRLHGFVRLGLCLALLVPATVACGPSQPANTVKDVQPGTMPSGQEWKGVYYSQMYGFLHLTEDGGAINGAWRTTAGDKWGELHGEVKGDLLKYTWEEHKIGAVGPDASSSGSGYFFFRIPKEGEAPEIQGEWGLGDSNAGQTWSAVKQKNMEPDPKSVRPSEIEGRVGGGGWDDDKREADVDSPEGEEKPEGEGEKSEGDKAEGEKSEEKSEKK